MKCESIKENPCSDLAEGCQWYTIQTAYFDQQYTLYSNRHFPFVYTLTSKFVCISDGMRHFGCKYVCLKLLLSHDVSDMNIVGYDHLGWLDLEYQVFMFELSSCLTFSKKGSFSKTSTLSLLCDCTQGLITIR